MYARTRRTSRPAMDIRLQTLREAKRMSPKQKNFLSEDAEEAPLIERELLGSAGSSSIDLLPSHSQDIKHYPPPKGRSYIKRLFLGSGPSNVPRTIPLNTTQASVAYNPNVVRNQKYNVASFLPLVLYEQFKFFFNLYFLLVALSQFVPALKIGYLFTYFGPLSFVLLVTIGKEGNDDWKRYQRDEEANSQLYQRLTDSGFVEVPSSDLKVGDFVLIEKNQRVPADCVLLRTTESSGACFIRTDQLDGETDWKLRVAVPYTQNLGNDQALLRLRGSVYAEKPHKDIHMFVGNMNIETTTEGDHVEALNAENTLWANTVVASGNALGIIVYTGIDTRAVMNTSFPSTKVGQLDNEINRLSKILAVVTLILSIAMVGLNGFRGIWYIYMFRFLILFSSIIPISLRVNLDMGKTVYSMQIMRDRRIPDTVVRTSTIPEELGRIGYLLTDKTGTLTQNDMELKRLHMGTMSYGGESMQDVREHLVSAFSTRQEGAAFRYKRARDIASRVRDIVQALALCHNVTPVIAADGEITYQASSPDEVAIVKWTESVGVTLYFRDRQNVRIRTPEGPMLDYQILDVFPFTSETKRMGIIVKDSTTGEIFFYQKGADAIMSKIVQYNDWLDEECGNMAREGLRTLVIGRKRLSEDALQEFNRRYAEAKISVHDRNAAMQRVVSEVLECDLELLGLTGVEDKLQDDVKTTLELLRNAGIRIWMLTGDKIETATCIAVSTKLVSRNQTIHQISKVTNSMQAMEELSNIQGKLDCCLVIDGESLQTYLDRYCAEFIDVAIRLPAVVCCRCSPTQKAEITQLIKKCTGQRTCAIGDGGNDVSMIQAAHVGVGIVGKEGKQASLAADFSVTQFSHLTRLLLWHGRNSYKRSAKLSQFVIHRGLIISIMQAVFSSIFYFAPIALYQGMLLVGYATVFTMAPVFSLVLDKDVSEETALLYPELYKELRKGRSLSLKTFFIWLTISVYQGGAILMLATWLFEDEFVNIVSISFTALIFNELLMVALEINTWHPYMIYSEIITVALYISSMWVLKTDFDLTFILTTTFVWKSAVITALSSFPLYILKFAKWKWNPPSYTKLER
ncbi:putative NEO1-P-type ATPase [Fimicolochytrium jonesii]|uniref:putative NEO1-P-type ATPase n=1 Tax=Fimicolochytrium jonesii TaxID=1396493 RepID=UPI0022FEF983|nr:putative NEO1-P-type ATPase [Fimicolochytrium jonesii]KAI8816347.1 putative NEO1-P-type ATPase [Fimicolochytrium jonesii]